MALDAQPETAQQPTGRNNDMRNPDTATAGQYLADAAEDVKKLPGHLDADDQARAIITSAQVNAAAAITAALEALTHEVTRLAGGGADLPETAAGMDRQP